MARESKVNPDWSVPIDLDNTQSLPTRRAFLRAGGFAVAAIILGPPRIAHAYSRSDSGIYKPKPPEVPPVTEERSTELGFQTIESYYDGKIYIETQLRPELLKDLVHPPIYRNSAYFTIEDPYEDPDKDLKVMTVAGYNYLSDHPYKFLITYGTMNERLGLVNFQNLTADEALDVNFLTIKLQSGYAIDAATLDDNHHTLRHRAIYTYDKYPIESL